MLFYCCMKKRKTFHVNLWRWSQRGQQLPPCTVRPAGRGSTASEWMKENKIVSDLFKKSVKQITDSFFFLKPFLLSECEQLLQAAGRHHWLRPAVFSIRAAAHSLSTLVCFAYEFIRIETSEYYRGRNGLGLFFTLIGYLDLPKRKKERKKERVPMVTGRERGA